MDSRLQSWKRFSGITVADKIEAVEYDERFQEDIWQHHLILTCSRNITYLPHVGRRMPFLPRRCHAPKCTKTAFWIRQVLNSIAPTNFFWTNPVAMQRMMEARRQSVLQGMRHFVTDSKLNTIRMVDNQAFTVGKELANTTAQ
ncbi:MAG: hypothetical protein R3E08_00940 [Thiotrichaceae bacterium]